MQRSFVIAAAILSVFAAAPSSYGQGVVYFDAQSVAAILDGSGQAGGIVYGITDAESNASRVTDTGSATSSVRLDRRMAKLQVEGVGLPSAATMWAAASGASYLPDTVRFRTNSQADLAVGGSIEFDYFLAWQLNGNSYIGINIGELSTDHNAYQFQKNELNLNAPDASGRSFGQYALSLPLTSVVAAADAEGEWLGSGNFNFIFGAHSFAGGSDIWTPPASSAIVEFRIIGGRIWDSTRTTSYPIIDEFQTAASDFNADGRVDGADFLEWQRGNGDASGDGVSGQFDLEIWKHQFGLGSTPDLVPMPEPSPLAISVIAAATLILQPPTQPLAADLIRSHVSRPDVTPTVGDAPPLNLCDRFAATLAIG